MHPWHDSYIDDSLIATAFPVVIEIPKGSTNKYELDKETGLLRLDRVFTVRSTTRPITASSRALFAMTATRSTSWYSDRNRSIR
jgi:hypothetical protein